MIGVRVTKAIGVRGRVVVRVRKSVGVLVVVVGVFVAVGVRI